MRPTPPANLLVLMSDEHNPKFLGAAGHPFVATPNLDALAARGTRFTSAYTTCPICVPARAAFATLATSRMRPLADQAGQTSRRLPRRPRRSGRKATTSRGRGAWSTPREVARRRPGH